MKLNRQLITIFNQRTKDGFIFNQDNIDLAVIENKIKGKMLIGGFFKDVQYSNIHLSDVTHITNKIYVEYDGIYADIEILDTHKGQILKELIQNEFKLYFRITFMLDTPFDKWNAMDIAVRNKDEDYFDMLTFDRKRKIKHLLECITDV